MNTEERELDSLMRTAAGCVHTLFPHGDFALIIRLPVGEITIGNKGRTRTKSLFRRGLTIMTAEVKGKKK